MNSINNVKPKELQNESFKYQYSNLALHVNYNGTLLIARDFISRMYVHMGFQRPMSFKKVIELTFENGSLIKEEDLSKKMAEQRKRNPSADAAPKSPSDPDVRNWIAKTFSKEYSLDDEE